jgi:hypothetical protein
VLSNETIQRPSLLTANGPNQSAYQPTMPSISTWAIEKGNGLIDAKGAIDLFLGTASRTDAFFTIVTLQTGIAPPISDSGKLLLSSIKLLGEGIEAAGLGVAIINPVSLPLTAIALGGFYVLYSKAGDDALELANKLVPWPKQDKPSYRPSKGTPEGDLYYFNGTTFFNDGPSQPSGPMPRPGLLDDDEFDA